VAARMDKGQIWHVCRLPVLIWVALCTLLAATCTLAYVPMGEGNLPVSLAIAAAKAALIGTVFMRLRENNRLNRLAACAGPVWLFIMFLLIGADYFTR
jgi:cytochrome c oxidase subunit 4